MHAKWDERNDWDLFGLDSWANVYISVVDTFFTMENFWPPTHSNILGKKIITFFRWALDILNRKLLKFATNHKSLEWKSLQMEYRVIFTTIMSTISAVCHILDVENGTHLNLRNKN